MSHVFLQTGHNPKRPHCLAGHVRLELRNVVAKYPFERSLRFPGIQQNSDHRDYSPLSCGVGWTQLGPRTQGITEETATPWGRPESFSIEGARRLRSSGAPRLQIHRDQLADYALNDVEKLIAEPYPPGISNSEAAAILRMS